MTFLVSQVGTGLSGFTLSGAPLTPRRRYSHLPGIPRNSLPWSAALLALAMKKRFLFESLGVLNGKHC